MSIVLRPFLSENYTTLHVFCRCTNWQIDKLLWNLREVWIMFVLSLHIFYFLKKNHPLILVKCTLKYLSSICRWSQTLRPFMKTWKYPVDSILYNSIMTLAIALIAKRSSSILMVVTFERRNIRIKVRENQRLEPI